MPINKNALARYVVIDRLLSDPYRKYTSRDIADAVSRETDQNVSLRQIQIDIQNLTMPPFSKQLDEHAGGHILRYEDQSQPLFSREMSEDEKVIMKEVLNSLGQFEGVENFTWLELLKKKLAITTDTPERPIIVFDRSQNLQIQDNLLAKLYIAISRKKVIRFTYHKFDGVPVEMTVFPYQLRQYNGRWFLVCNYVGSEEHPYRPEKLATMALDRFAGELKYVDEINYIDTPIDIAAGYDEIVGVSFIPTTVINGEIVSNEPQSIVFGVKPKSVGYVRTKKLHLTQMELVDELQVQYKEKYPALYDCTFFTIECRENYELYSLLLSFGGNLTVIEPANVRNNLREKLRENLRYYNEIVRE